MNARQAHRRRQAGARARQATRRHPRLGLAVLLVVGIGGLAVSVAGRSGQGVIHVESPTVRRYTLGEFFAVWGVRFTQSCLGGYCAGGGRRLRVYVNGAAYRGDPTTLPLASHQELVVAFGTASQLPSPIPSTYRFPPGL